METFSRGTLEPWYLTGYADGAGSFTYSRSGHQIAVYFALKSPDRAFLEDVQSFFGGLGKIYEVGDAGGGETRPSYFRVSRRDELPLVVEHFDRYPLRTRKKDAYAIWRQMVMAKQEFRRPDRALLDTLAAQLTAASGRGAG